MGQSTLYRVDKIEGVHCPIRGPRWGPPPIFGLNAPCKPALPFGTMPKSENHEEDAQSNPYPAQRDCRGLLQGDGTQSTRSGFDTFKCVRSVKGAPSNPHFERSGKAPRRTCGLFAWGCWGSDAQSESGSYRILEESHGLLQRDTCCIFAYCGLVVEIQPTSLRKFKFCSPNHTHGLTSPGAWGLDLWRAHVHFREAPVVCCTAEAPWLRRLDLEASGVGRFLR